MTVSNEMLFGMQCVTNLLLGVLLGMEIGKRLRSMKYSKLLGEIADD